MSVIAIDYDNTYTNFKEEIDVFINALKKNGHDVMLVTARDEAVDPILTDISNFHGVIYTAGRAKAGEFRADLFLDDSPVTLCCNFIPGESHAEPGKALHQGYKDKHILWNWEEGRFVSYITKKFEPYAKNQIKTISQENEE